MREMGGRGPRAFGAWPKPSRGGAAGGSHLGVTKLPPRPRTWYYREVAKLDRNNLRRLATESTWWSAYRHAELGSAAPSKVNRLIPGTGRVEVDANLLVREPDVRRTLEEIRATIELWRTPDSSKPTSG